MLVLMEGMLKVERIETQDMRNNIMISFLLKKIKRNCFFFFFFGYYYIQINTHSTFPKIICLCHCIRDCDMYPNSGTKRF